MSKIRIKYNMFGGADHIESKTSNDALNIFVNEQTDDLSNDNLICLKDLEYIHVNHRGDGLYLKGSDLGVGDNTKSSNFKVPDLPVLFETEHTYNRLDKIPGSDKRKLGISAKVSTEIDEDGILVIYAAYPFYKDGKTEFKYIDDDDKGVYDKTKLQSESVNDISSLVIGDKQIRPLRIDPRLTVDDNLVFIGTNIRIKIDEFGNDEALLKRVFDEQSAKWNSLTGENVSDQYVPLPVSQEQAQQLADQKVPAADQEVPAANAEHMPNYNMDPKTGRIVSDIRLWTRNSKPEMYILNNDGSGDCLFYSIRAGLATLTNPDKSKFANLKTSSMRKYLCDVIADLYRTYENKQSDINRKRLQDAINIINGSTLTEEKLLEIDQLELEPININAQMEIYCKYIYDDGTSVNWGSYFEAQVFANVLRVKIMAWNSGQNDFEIYGPQESQDVIYLHYNGHSHYQTLIPFTFRGSLIDIKRNNYSKKDESFNDSRLVEELEKIMTPGELMDLLKVEEKTDTQCAYNLGEVVIMADNKYYVIDRRYNDKQECTSLRLYPADGNFDYEDLDKLSKLDSSEFNEKTGGLAIDVPIGAVEKMLATGGSRYSVPAQKVYKLPIKYD